jgi:hypothetical protein
MRQKGQSGRALPSLSSQAVVRNATRDGTAVFCKIISFAEGSHRAPGTSKGSAGAYTS